MQAVVGCAFVCASAVRVAVHAAGGAARCKVLVTSTVGEMCVTGFLYIDTQRWQGRTSHLDD
jgi:hypothetical protein